jgi:CRISPR-associated endoribonuclease Cas6
MGIHADPNGLCHFKAGQSAWFRVTTLTDELTEHLNEWLYTISKPSLIKMGESRWQIEKISTRSDEHLWAGQISYDALLGVIQSRLSKGRWTLEFATPMTINGSNFCFPFPQPESLVRSWLKRWQAFAPYTLPDDLPEQVREHLAILNYDLTTETVRMHGKKWPGCLGKITFQDLGMTPEMRQTLDVLMQYSFFCGSGYKTTQGLGQTRLLN